jgi:hypothetical protein
MIFADNHPKLAEQLFPLTEQYQTISLGFTSPDPATYKFMAFSMGVYGDVIIDGIAVVPTAAAANVDFLNVPQVAFQVAAGGDASMARIVFSDEPAVVDYYAGGKVAGATLRTRLVTVYGDTFPLPDVVLEKDNAPGKIEVLAHLPANRRMGSFRIEGWVERKGKRISTEQEYVFHRIPRPRYWGQDAPQSMFGILSLPQTASGRWITVKSGETPQSGCTSAVRWQSPSPGTPRWPASCENRPIGGANPVQMWELCSDSSLNLTIHCPDLPPAAVRPPPGTLPVCRRFAVEGL